MNETRLILALCDACRRHTWVRDTDNLCVKCAQPEAKEKRWLALADSVGLGDCFAEVRK